jgi:copper chaperone
MASMAQSFDLPMMSRSSRLGKWHNRRMETVELKVEGMDCEGCVKSVTRMLSGVAGVEKVHVSLQAGRATVTYDPAKTKIGDMKRAIERAGYKAP